MGLLQSEILGYHIRAVLLPYKTRHLLEPARGSADLFTTTSPFLARIRHRSCECSDIFSCLNHDD